MRRMIMFNIFGNLSSIISLRSKKKIRVIRHVKQIIWQETYKSLDFLKIHSQNRVGEVHGFGSKMPIFEENFFSNASRKFSMRRMIMFNIFGRLSNIISLRSKKKLESYDTPIRRYKQKPASSRKKTRFKTASLCTTVGSDFMKRMDSSMENEKFH